VVVASMQLLEADTTTIIICCSVHDNIDTFLEEMFFGMIFALFGEDSCCHLSRSLFHRYVNRFHHRCLMFCFVLVFVCLIVWFIVCLFVCLFVSLFVVFYYYERIIVYDSKVLFTSVNFCLTVNRSILLLSFKAR
jgi:hypothetical protein